MPLPDTLKGLRVRLVTPAAPIERQAYGKLKKLLSEHGKYLSEKTLAAFRQSLNGLLLHGLRAREVETPKAKNPKNAPDENWVRFTASDGRMYQAHPNSWPKVQKRDPGARQIEKKAAAPKESLANRLFSDTLKNVETQRPSPIRNS